MNRAVSPWVLGRFVPMRHPVGPRSQARRHDGPRCLFQREVALLIPAVVEPARVSSCRRMPDVQRGINHRKAGRVEGALGVGVRRVRTESIVGVVGKVFGQVVAPSSGRRVGSTGLVPWNSGGYQWLFRAHEAWWMS